MVAELNLMNPNFCLFRERYLTRMKSVQSLRDVRMQRVLCL
jgi:hypothetical protein